MGRGTSAPAQRSCRKSVTPARAVPDTCVEDPDRAIPSASSHERLRQRVNEELHDIVLQDQLALCVPAIEVTGSPSERARQVLRHIPQRRMA